MCPLHSVRPGGPVCSAPFFTGQALPLRLVGFSEHSGISKPPPHNKNAFVMGISVVVMCTSQDFWNMSPVSAMAARDQPTEVKYEKYHRCSGNAGGVEPVCRGDSVPAGSGQEGRGPPRTRGPGQEQQPGAGPVLASEDTRIQECPGGDSD